VPTLLGTALALRRSDDHRGATRKQLAAGTVRRLASRRVLLEAGEPDVAVRLVLDEAEGPRADDLLQRALTGGVDDLLGIDGGPGLGDGERVEEIPDGSLSWTTLSLGPPAATASTDFHPARPRSETRPQRFNEATTSLALIVLPL